MVILQNLQTKKKFLMGKMKAVVLLSGNGSNFKNILDRIKDGYLNMEICAVISDNEKAYGLQRAKDENIKTFSLKDNINDDLNKFLDKIDLDLIILAGYMKILPPDIVDKYNGKILNIHPSLLPKYKGMNTHQRVIEDKESFHGATVHFVTDKLDGGPLILQQKISVDAKDTAETLKEKVHCAEYSIYPLVIKWYIDGLLEQSENNFLFKGEKIESPIQDISNIK
ncbi:MAG: phosphoribosylglycinamide formyltransferase [Gammaproteobacteria bacterium]|nr:phosphoribosylglycinamide formyltransferase [Gammaproteobacteria bacterium]